MFKDFEKFVGVLRSLLRSRVDSFGSVEVSSYYLNDSNWEFVKNRYDDLFVKATGFVSVDLERFCDVQEVFEDFRDGVHDCRLRVMDLNELVEDLYCLFVRCDRDLLVDSDVICLGGYSEYKKKIGEELSDSVTHLLSDVDDKGFVFELDSILRDIFVYVSKADNKFDGTLADKELVRRLNSVFDNGEFKAACFSFRKGIELLKGLTLDDKGFVLSKDYVYGSFLVREGLLKMRSVLSLSAMLLMGVSKNYLCQVTDMNDEEYGENFLVRRVWLKFDELFEFNDRFIDEKI